MMSLYPNSIGMNMSESESCCIGKLKRGVDRGVKLPHRVRLSEEMNMLSVQEREKVYDEIHGVAGAIDETPELVETSLRDLREEIAKVPKVSKKALERAMFLRPELEMDDKFHLMFLRAEKFDPVKAARKLCRHFENKLLLFGEEALPRDITLDDLSEKEMDCMYKGSCVFLPDRDRKGRAIRLIDVMALPMDWETIMRYCWYQIMTVLEDENVQKHGTVNVSLFMGERKYPVGDMINTVKNCTPVLNDWPYRTAGFHLCYDNAALRSFLDLSSFFMGKDFRLRERSHFGSELEVKYSLLPFGIILPVSLKQGVGPRSREFIESYLNERRQKEASRKAELNALFQRDNFVPYPEPSDILMGRNQKWPGNDEYAKLVHEHVGLYHKASERLDKTVIAMKILQILEERGGRFLQRTERGWMAVDAQTATEKIGQALRVQTLKEQKEGRFQSELGADAKHVGSPNKVGPPSKKRRT